MAERRSVRAWPLAGPPCLADIRPDSARDWTSVFFYLACRTSKEYTKLQVSSLSLRPFPVISSTFYAVGHGRTVTVTRADSEEWWAGGRLARRTLQSAFCADA